MAPGGLGEAGLRYSNRWMPLVYSVVGRKAFAAGQPAFVTPASHHRPAWTAGQVTPEAAGELRP